MSWFGNWKPFGGRKYSVVRGADGKISYWLDGKTSFDGGHDYLDMSLTNIALFTAFDIKATMVSRGRVTVMDLDEKKEYADDVFLKKMANPNFFQSQQDHIYQHQWFKSLGTNVNRIIKINDNGKANDINNVKSFNNLVPSCINWNKVNKIDKMIISEGDYKELLKREIKYKVGDKEYPIALSDLQFFYDVTNGMTNDSVFKSESRIKALIPALSNISEAQKAKNINLQFSSKFLAVNQKTELNTIQPLGEGERGEIESALSNKGITATNANIKVESLANDFRRLLYDDGIAAEATKIFNAYGINRDVLNWWMNGASTHDNRSTGIASWIQSSIQFEADDWANTWTSHFNYRDEGKKIVVKFDHLPEMQVFEKEKREAAKERAETFKALVDAGASFETAAIYAGLEDLKKGKNEATANS